MPDDLTGTIADAPLADALSERYLAYALSTIMSRSLPDVRDGLKPVHRRLIYAMHQLRLDPAAGFKKCARVIGDVIGKYHPHGEASVYDALVRLAQEFAARYPLVEGQGNFGNIDGDNPAAMRYTEARMTAVASAMLDGIDEDAVDLKPNYDGEEAEPVVLPAGFPNLLANGAAGIAVGMACSIPPHNAVEVCNAALALIADPSATTADLLTHMPGPDFPTGGVVVESPTDLLAAYQTGRGGFRLRAAWTVEPRPHGMWQIAVTAIPYQVQKTKLIEQLADLLEAKKLPLLADIRDESTDQVRLLLEPKTRSTTPSVLMESLFRVTQLETRFPLNMNVLTADRTPVVLGLVEVLRAWLDHRDAVLARRSTYRLAAVQRRLELLDGFLAVFLDIDEVIRIIRQEDDARAGLMRQFELSELQAEAILSMRLRSLRRLEEIELRREHSSLQRERGVLTRLLSNPSARWKRIADEIRVVRERFAGGSVGSRRTVLAGPPPDVDSSDYEDPAEDEPLTIVVSEKGWIRALRGHGLDATDLKFKDGDQLGQILICQTSDRLCLLSTGGRVHTLRAALLPKGRGDGQPIRLLVEMAHTDSIVTVFTYRDDTRYLVASSDAKGFLIEAADLLTDRKAGKQILNLQPDAVALLCIPAIGDHLATAGTNRRLLVFPLSQLPCLARGAGVILQRFKTGQLCDAKAFTLADGLSWQLGEKTRRETDLREWLGDRGQAGRAPPTGFPKDGKFGG